MNLDFHRMREKYGALWHIYPPDMARPVYKTHHLVAPTVEPGEIERDETCRHKADGNQVLVVSRMSVKSFVDIPNPNYPGNIPLALEDIALAGRMSWKPVIARSSAAEIDGDLDEGVYTNAAAVLVGANYKGLITAGGTFGIWPHSPSIIVYPGSVFLIQVEWRDDSFGIDPPVDVGSEIRVLVTFEGYSLPVAA